MVEKAAFWRITWRDLPCLEELRQWLDNAAQEMMSNEDLDLMILGEIDQPGKNNLWFFLGRIDPSAEPEEFGPYQPYRSFCCFFLEPHLPGYMIVDPDVYASGELQAPEEKQ